MGKIIKVSGPLVVADGMADANMADVVRVGPQQLIGEILNMTGDRASIQVYEETGGLSRRACRKHGRPAVGNARPRYPAQYLRWYPAPAARH